MTSAKSDKAPDRAIVSIYVRRGGACSRTAWRAAQRPTCRAGARWRESAPSRSQHLVRVGVRVRVRVTAAHRADLPHLKRFRARIRVRVRVSVGTAGHAGQVTLTLAQT